MINKQERIRNYQKLVRRADALAAEAEAAKHFAGPCEHCEFYQPFFKYRRCLYTECAYKRVKNVFLKKPLAEDIVEIRRKQRARK